MLPLDARRRLDLDGFTSLEGIAPPELVTELQNEVERLWAAEGDRAGLEFRPEPGARRLANLADKGNVFRRLAVEPLVLDAVRVVLGPKVKLSSLNARSAEPGAGVRQPLHADMGTLPDEHGYRVANAVWMLDDFTAENGPLRVVPGTHRAERLPEDALADPLAPHPDELLVTGRAGTVVVMNAHAWHGGLENTTHRPRRAIHAFYCRRDVPQQQYQKALLRAETQAALSPELRDLLALDDPLNDRISGPEAGDVRRSGFLR